ncbi:MAG TPA: hypothetical protein VNA28_05605, partial [Solirubrobacteraceae bacterium]|nr:hypothetical protein [Solirubrobacteraceae bacterium]
MAMPNAGRSTSTCHHRARRRHAARLASTAALSRRGVHGRCSVEPVIGELPVFEPLLRRAPIFYAWPVAADVLATAVVLVWCVGALGETALRPLAVLVVPLVLILGKAEQLHAGDQGPRLVHLATLCALLACLLHGWFAAGELGPHHALLLWGAIF